MKIIWATNRVEKSFDPSVSVKYINPKTGELIIIPIADYIQRVKSAATVSVPGRKIEIVSLHFDGKGVQGRIRIASADAVLPDFMNLRKENGE